MKQTLYMTDFFLLEAFCREVELLSGELAGDELALSFQFLDYPLLLVYPDSSEGNKICFNAGKHAVLQEDEAAIRDVLEQVPLYISLFYTSTLPRPKLIATGSTPLFISPPLPNKPGSKPQPIGGSSVIRTVSLIDFVSGKLFAKATMTCRLTAYGEKVPRMHHPSDEEAMRAIESAPAPPPLFYAATEEERPKRLVSLKLENVQQEDKAVSAARKTYKDEGLQTGDSQVDLIRHTLNQRRKTTENIHEMEEEEPRVNQVANQRKPSTPPPQKNQKPQPAAKKTASAAKEAAAAQVESDEERAIDSALMVLKHKPPSLPLLRALLRYSTYSGALDAHLSNLAAKKVNFPPSPNAKTKSKVASKPVQEEDTGPRIRMRVKPPLDHHRKIDQTQTVKRKKRMEKPVHRPQYPPTIREESQYPPTIQEVKEEESEPKLVDNAPPLPLHRQHSLPVAPVREVSSGPEITRSISELPERKETQRLTTQMDQRSAGISFQNNEPPLSSWYGAPPGVPPQQGLSHHMAWNPQQAAQMSAAMAGVGQPSGFQTSSVMMWELMNMMTMRSVLGTAVAAMSDQMTGIAKQIVDQAVNPVLLQQQMQLASLLNKEQNKLAKQMSLNKKEKQQSEGDRRSEHGSDKRSDRSDTDAIDSIQTKKKNEDTLNRAKTVRLMIGGPPEKSTGSVLYLKPPPSENAQSVETEGKSSGESAYSDDFDEGAVMPEPSMAMANVGSRATAVSSGGWQRTQSIPQELASLSTIARQEKVESREASEVAESYEDDFDDVVKAPINRVVAATPKPRTLNRTITRRSDSDESIEELTHSHSVVLNSTVHRAWTADGPELQMVQEMHQSQSSIHSSSSGSTGSVRSSRPISHAQGSNLSAKPGRRHKSFVGLPSLTPDSLGLPPPAYRVPKEEKSMQSVQSSVSSLFSRDESESPPPLAAVAASANAPPPPPPPPPESEHSGSDVSFFSIESEEAAKRAKKTKTKPPLPPASKKAVQTSRNTILTEEDIDEDASIAFSDEDIAAGLSSYNDEEIASRLTDGGGRGGTSGGGARRGGALAGQTNDSFAQFLEDMSDSDEDE